jgi:hypothetical protein
MTIAARAAALTESEASPKRSVRSSGVRLLALCLVAVCLIAYSVYAEHQRKVTAKFKAHEQAAQRATKDAADRKAREQQREAAALIRARQEAERRAAMSPIQIREKNIREQFSIWDGSHNATEAAIKARMHNPDSYKHVKTVYSDNGMKKGLSVQTTFRGTNAFGAVVTNIAVAKVDDAGHVITLEMLNLRRTSPDPTNAAVFPLEIASPTSPDAAGMGSTHVRQSR